MSLDERRSHPLAYQNPPAKRDPNRKKQKGTGSFWRACRDLYPYRGIVAISIACAIFVSIANTAGLSAMLPIMQVLVKGDTIANWADREIAQHRLGVKFAGDVKDLAIVKVRPEGAAASAGLHEQDILFAPPNNSHPDIVRWLTAVSDPATTHANIRVRDGGSVSLSLPPLSRTLVLARAAARHVPTHPVKAIALAFGAIALLAILSNIAKFFQEYLSDKAAVMTVNDIRRRLYDRVLHIPLSHFNLRGTSDVTSRLTQDAQGLSEGFKTVLGQSIQEPVKAAMAFAFALFLSWRLTLFIIVFAPLLMVIIKKFGKKMRRASKKALISSSVMLGQIDSSLIGIRVVKGANAERFERRKYTRIMDQLVNEQLRMSRIDSFSEPTVETLTLFVVGIVVLFASYMVLIAQSLDVTIFFMVMACLASIGDSLRRVSKVNNVLQKADAAATRIFEVLDLPIEKKASKYSTAAVDRPRIKLAPLQREVRFEHVTFAYPGTTAPAVSDVTLTVPRGKCIAVVGRNGSGKTTLLALLPRFYDPQKGRILIDGIDVRTCTLRSLRDQISLVTQDSVIFPGTIAENIAYGHPLVSVAPSSEVGREVRAQIEEAARRAFAHDFIMEKPSGYDTLLGGLGAQLSGGQKQRICIARAIFRKSPILVLDEATSQVDAESEALIQTAINSLIHERTTFVIAHRFSTILNADEILVMDRGRIVGMGRHEELLRTCETYNLLYERQLVAAPAAEALCPAPV